MRKITDGVAQGLHLAIVIDTQPAS
uniref:Uncharacterized protein n=1 Tax=Anguilla anguilla TaxID=7936 RepID=A0A0E9W933_ANGAN